MRVPPAPPTDDDAARGVAPAAAPIAASVAAPILTAAAPREPAIDHLRALMMWLGIVLHASANHLTGPWIVPWRDPDTSRLADALVAVIHVFRMPLFLMLAGYFVAMTVQRQGATAMLRHRLRRLALPFAVFWPPLFVLTALLVMVFVHRVARGDVGLDPALVPQLPHASMINTLHLWFLYQLCGFVVVTAACCRWGPRRGLDGARALGARWLRLAERPWAFAVFALPLALVGASDRFGIVTVSGSFAPPWREWLHHGAFYAFGYAMYAGRDRWLAHCRHHAAALGAAGLVALALSLPMIEALQRDPDGVGGAWRLGGAWAYNAATWLWCFALLGVAQRVLDRPDRRLAYLAQSAYWVYLVHMLGTIGVGAALVGLPWPVAVKILVNVIVTSALALLTYHVLVRGRPLGVLLGERPAALAGSRPPKETVG